MSVMPLSKMMVNVMQVNTDCVKRKLHDQIQTLLIGYDMIFYCLAYRLLNLTVYLHPHWCTEHAGYSVERLTVLN